MTLLLRKSSAQARIEGWDPSNRSDDDYAVVDDTIVGRIYREMILGKPKWRVVPAADPGGRSGEADSAVQSRDGRYVGAGAGGVR